MIHPSRPSSNETRRWVAGFACAGVLALGSCDERASIGPEGPPLATGGAAGASGRPGPIRERPVADRLVATPGTWVPAPEGDGAARETGTGGASSTDAGADAPPKPLGDTCPEGLPGAKLVRVPAERGGYFCMDQRETTAGEYRAFLAARGGDTSGQPPECAWNERFDPELYDPTDPNFDDPDTHDKCGVQTWAYLEAHPDHAAACVDFCDAFAYCAWAGKRLCGRVGADGTKVARAATAPSGGYDAELFAQSFELYRACTQGGSTAYPYGDVASPGLCKDAQWLAAQGLDSMAVEPVGGQCHGTQPPYDQLYDLAGSVSEWANLSVPYGRTAVLNIERQHAADQSKCDSALGWAGPSSLGPGLGIRCCADALFEGSAR